MTYELAKQLKDAGFPLIHSSTKRCWLQLSRMDYDEPTLSELIEACQPLKEFSLIYDEKFGWECRGVRYDGKMANIAESRLTPETAVAKLYIALKTK